MKANELRAVEELAAPLVEHLNHLPYRGELAVILTADRILVCDNMVTTVARDLLPLTQEVHQNAEYPGLVLDDNPQKKTKQRNKNGNHGGLIVKAGLAFLLGIVAAYFLGF